VELVVGGVAADNGVDREGGDGLGDGEGSVVEGVDVAVALVEGVKVGVDIAVALVEGVKVGVVGAIALVEGVVVDGEGLLMDNIVLDRGVMNRMNSNRDHLLGQFNDVLHRGGVLGVAVGGHAVDAGHAETVAVAANVAGHGRGSAAGNSHQGDHVGLHVGRLEGIVERCSR